MKTRNTNLKANDARRTALWTALGAGILAASLGVSGCEELVMSSGCNHAHAPVDLYSVTGDREVIVYWTPVERGYVDSYVVYRSSSPDGPFVEQGHSRGDTYVDDRVTNGRTYYYAVSAVDACGYETELSRDLAYDTPRPEGFGAQIFDANGTDWRRSAWEFDAYRAVSWDSDLADVYFIRVDGTALLVAADLQTDIQDAGYAGFDDVSWAPTEGWSPSGTVEVVPGHVYIVWTRDNHFAKVRARSLSGGSLVFDWAYQIDAGNPELAPRPVREPSPLNVSPGLGA